MPSPPPPPLPNRGRFAATRKPPPPPSGPDAVQNADIERLIPLVNKLQDALSLTDAKGEISLPQIAVVGGQSSGKSSVLENIVGKSFLPRGAGIVTRRPLVLQLVNGAEEYGEFLHAPGRRFDNFDAIRKEIEADTDRVCGGNKGLDPRAIHLKVSSPHVLNLTLIDLPGATKVPVGDQHEDTPRQIREMILSYISKPTCIVLAVTSANTDLANSDAIQLSREVDPTGDRTLGVLTKLDLMDRGTDARGIFSGESADLPRLKLGYVGVVNRSQADIQDRKTIRQARQAETEFFTSNPAYSDLADRLGTAFLVTECSKLLAAHIRTSLPTLDREITVTLEKKKKELADIGDHTPDAQRRKLTEKLLEFCDRFQALVTGKELPGDSGHRVNELAGGARIERVFRDIFEPAVASLQVLDDLSPAEVQTLVRNCQGLGGGLFTPDQAFKQLVQRNVKRLRQPAMSCANSVHAELASLIADAGNFKTLHAYPDLKASLETFVGEILRANLDAASDHLNTHVDMELCRINISHPEFVGSSGTANLMASVEAKFQKQEPIKQPPPPPPLPNGNRPPVQQQQQQSKPSWLKRNNDAGPAGKKTMTAEETAAWREKMLSEVGPVKPPPRPDDPQDDKGPPVDIARFSLYSQGLSLKEKVEVHVICELCASYFAIVKKTFSDFIPKAVTLKLVDATTRSLTSKVLAELNTEEAAETLMAAAPAMQKLVASLKASVAALTEAKATLAAFRF